MNERRIAALLSALTDLLAGHRCARTSLVAHFNAATEREIFEWIDRVHDAFDPDSPELRLFGSVYDRLARQYETRYPEMEMQ